MKSFLDNKLSSITNRHSNLTPKKGEKEIVRSTSEPSIYDVIKAVKEQSKERPDDKGLKYSLAQLHFFGRKNGYTSPATAFVSTITASCQKMFPYSRVAGALKTAMETVSLKLDTAFLDKVAELVTEQDSYDGIVSKLELTDDSVRSIESRKYLANKVNTMKGADTVNNLMYDITEVKTQSSPLSESILDKNELISAFRTQETNYDTTPFELHKSAEFMQIIDFASFPVSYESFDVRTAQYQLLDTLPENEWIQYLTKMAEAGISVSYNTDEDTFEVASFNMTAEPEEKGKGTTKLEYEPAGKAPGGIKYKTRPPEGREKKEQPIITKLEGQAKEAFTKIFKRTEQLRKLKDKQMEIQANLTAIKNEYSTEKETVAAELENYLKFAESSFKKLELAEETVYALETQEGVILAAIKQTSKITIPEDPTKEIVSADAQNILDRLKKMGKVTDDLVAEVEKQINDENSMIKTIEHVTKTMYTWPPAQKDVEKVKGEVKQAGPLDKFMSMLKGAIDGAKKFFGMVDKNVDALMDEYQELQGILEKY